MATSGSVNYSQTRNEIIQDAFQHLGIYGIEGRTISSADMKFASNQLNKMVKAWQAKGLHLWTKTEALLFIADNVGEYTLSNASSSAKASLRDSTVITEINGALASGVTSITVDDTTGMTAADVIGIVQDDDSVHWSTISSVDSSTTLTLGDATTDTVADNSNVYTFTSRINKPLRVHAMRRISGTPGSSAQSEIPMTELSHEEFFDLPNKNTNGVPSHFYYNPKLTDGALYIWPRPSDPETYFGFTYSRMIEDFDGASDDADFPSEWLEVLALQLAVRLGPAFGKGKKAQLEIAPLAGYLLDEMLAWDSEKTSLEFSPDPMG